jgi:hypothetical protein
MSPSAAFSFAVVCEAPADLELSAGLADRVLCREVEWIADSDALEMHRLWRGLAEADSHLEWHWVTKIARERNVKAHGHFVGEPGALDATMARKALLLLKDAHRPPDAVILVRDTDGLEERRLGLRQARDASDWPFQVVLAIAHAKRECWILAGFEPLSKAETKALKELRKELGFDPRIQAESLTAAEPQAPRNAKRVLERLFAGNRNREEDCWRSCDLTVLAERGRFSGLADYLEEVRSRLVPLFAGNQPKD